MAVVAFGFTSSTPTYADRSGNGMDNGHGNPGNNGGNTYVQHNLVSDLARHRRPPGHEPQERLGRLNDWGVFFNPNGPVWVANNTTGTSTLDEGNGNGFPAGSPLVVTIPSVDGSGQGVPTGLTFNSSADFVITAGVPAKSIFATEDGVIAAWASGPAAVKMYPPGNMNPTGAVYKAVALAGNDTPHFLYAADFVEVFDSTFAALPFFGGFNDPGIPPEYGPFNIMNINGTLYVAYAVKEAAGDDVTGQGLGFIDAYDPNGVLLGRVASRGTLNAPWGMALAPDGFGKFSNALIVGNFGDGKLQGYDLVKGTPLGQLLDTNNSVLAIDGLWGIQFGNGLLDQPTTTLFFTAGPNAESEGLYGSIIAAVSGPPGHGH